MKKLVSVFLINILLPLYMSASSVAGLAANSIAEGQLTPYLAPSQTAPESFSSLGAALPPAAFGVDMYSMDGVAPARIAADRAGVLYVTDSVNNAVYLYSNNGVRISKITGVSKPLGIAVDRSGLVYISDTERGSVGFYDRGRLVGKLGKGDGEFLLPNDIAVGSNGSVYVSDSKANAVKVYLRGLIGTGLSYAYDIGAGILQQPAGVTVDDSAGEVYVIDYGNIYVRVFDLAGNLKRSIRGSGGMMGGGKILSPLGVAVDSSRLYVADSYHSTIAAFDKTTGVFLSYIGNYGTGLKEFRTPTDVVIDSEGKMFVTNTNNQRIEIIGLDTFSGLRIAPQTADFSVIYGGNSVTQSVTISSVGTDTSWTATTSIPWIQLSSTSGTTPSSIGITVNPINPRAGYLRAGFYSGQVIFKTPSGTEAILPVTIEARAVQSSFSVAPSSMTLTYSAGGSLPSGTVFVNSDGAVLNWSVRSMSDWIRLSRTGGVTPDSVQVSVTDAVRSFPSGRYNGSIIFNAGNVAGSPATVSVQLDVINKGSIKVTTNLDAAGFSITGPANLAGSGTSWTAENVDTGSYSITFNHVSGHVRPPARSFNVEGGKTAEVSGIYTRRSVATHIIAATGNPSGNAVTVLTTAGVPEFVLTPFASASGVKAVAADLDGDGLDEIIVSNTVNEIAVYNNAGARISGISFALSKGLSSQFELSAADLNGDGKMEIIIGYSAFGTVKVSAYSLRGNAFVPAGYMLSSSINGRFSIGAGDIDGDGQQELLLGRVGGLTAYKIGPAVYQLWSRPLKSLFCPNIATGDMNDDGVAEIILGSGPDAADSGSVFILNGEGTDYGIDFSAFGDLGYGFGATVGTGDFDGDGKDDVIAGAGPGASNEPLVRLFDGAGGLLGTVKAFEGGFGVNANFGRLAR